MQMNRKTATKLLLVQWSRFQKVCMRLEGSTLFTGVNGSGKSTILDAMTYVLTGNTQFNKAARDRDRTVLAYVRGDTKSNGEKRYLRTGAVVSYIAMEFWSPVENMYLVVGVCIESPDETGSKSSWFVCRDTKIEQMNFYKEEDGKLLVTPSHQLSAKGKRLKGADLMRRDKGREQVLRALGLRCDVDKYRSKILKMMAFNPENNVNQFIQECVLEPGIVHSLQELREQKDRFEQIRQLYENLSKSKTQLELVEQQTVEYEKKLRMFHIREMMLAYQELQAAKKDKEAAEFRKKTLEQKRRSVQEQMKHVQTQFELARKRLQAAEANDLLQGMNQSIHSLEEQLSDLNRQIDGNQKELAKLKALQGKLSGVLRWFVEEMEDERVLPCLFRFAEVDYSEHERTEVFVQLCNRAQIRKEQLETERVHTEDAIRILNQEISDLEEKMKALEANKLVLPKEIREAKAVLAAELEKRGIHTPVRVFSELVQDIKDETWRAAIETFLGRKRYYIIVDGAYCHQALEILQEKKLYRANVVITDKLPNTEVQRGSAAEQLVISNPFARMYANYLLNGIHLCASLRELHDHPKGGLMKNGMLAKSFAVSYMNITRTEMCLGSRAIRLQKEQAQKAREEKRQTLQDQRKNLDGTKGKLNDLSEVIWEAEQYQFAAPQLVKQNQAAADSIQKEIEHIQNNPDFTTVLEEQQKAKSYFDRVDEKRQNLAAEEGICADKMKEEADIIQILAGQIDSCEQEYAEKSLMHLELKRPMMEEYEKLSKRQGAVRVIKQKTINNLRGEVEEARRQLENAQFEYCKMAEIDISKRGVAYIPFFREQYRNLANVQIEEARIQLDEQAARLESAFMNDFVAEINETVEAAKLEIDSINRELKQLPFGQDTYKFVMSPKADRAVFFRICKKLKNYLNFSEGYMNSAREDEEMEHDIQEFMNIILEDEDEAEYTDYRKYFTYDMEIVSRQGDTEVVADLSKKQGSASGGEKQTPYFIILAASLMQCYPRKTCCARLAFIDEAFSALSRERIEQMVRYLEDNSFQVIYAAPPEKISSIGQFITSTISLVVTGRYTNAVEGLVKADDIYGD